MKSEQDQTTPVSPSKQTENPLIPTAVLRKIRSLIVRCTDEASAAELGRGREAEAAAILAQLRPEDWIVCSHRDVPVLTARGITQRVENQNVVTELGPLSRIHYAAGLATHAQQSPRAGVVVVFSTASAISSRTVQALLLMAEQRRLPLILVADTRRDRELRLSRDVRVPLITVDRGDAIAVFRVAQESLDRARRDVGPTVIECRVVPGTNSSRLLERYLS